MNENTPNTEPQDSRDSYARKLRRAGMPDEKIQEHIASLERLEVEARCERHQIRIQGRCPKCDEEESTRNRIEKENRVAWSDGHYAITAFGLQFFFPNGNALNLEVKGRGRAFAEKWEELVARANRADRLRSALRDLLSCIEDGQCGDYSPMMDEYFDAKSAADPGWESCPDNHTPPSKPPVLAETGGWVSVEDRLPEKKGRYNVAYQQIKKVDTLYFWPGTGWESGDFNENLLTHWCTLPPPPVEQQGEEE